ncbi:HPr kinase/phosphatase C-terminal domain-containing protein [Altererythrobacter sp.]|nr:HPr kinase/phosphatase C-terminal domain-containing protein [Altererythrobacter sp.]
MTTYQASCVAVGGRALMIEGPPGAGKTSLALALIDRGAQLIGDDGVCIEARGAVLWALPPPNIHGKIEVRNVGMVTLPAVSGPLALVLTLDQQAPRYIAEAGTKYLAGFDIPQLAFFAADAIAAIRAEYAMEKFGLV